MFQNYSRDRVIRLLQQGGGTFTVRLGWSDGGWKPGDWAPIRGPAEQVTYTLRPDGRVEVEVERHDHWSAGPNHEHGITKNPVTALPPLSFWKRHPIVLLLAYLLSGVAGAVIGYLSTHSGQAAWVGWFVGLMIFAVGGHFLLGVSAVRGRSDRFEAD